MNRMMLAAAVLLMAGCGAAHGPDPAVAAAGPTLGAVWTADRVVRFVQGEAGVRYWVEGADGVLLEADLSLEGLASFDPELARLVDEAFARSSRSLDASTFGSEGLDRTTPDF